MQKFEFSKSYKFKNYSEIDEVLCDSKTFLNKLSLILLILVVLVSIFNLIIMLIDIIRANNLHLKYNMYDSEDVFIGIFALILFSIPTIFLFLRVVNFKFYINGTNVICKDWLGRERRYSTTDIKEIRLCINREGKRYIVVKFNDAENISISGGDRNFKYLRMFFGFES